MPNPPELSIIVPTYNESGNIPLLVQALTDALTGLNWEVIFVDDNSPDQTSAAVRELARANGRVRGVQRLGRRGLASAVIEGILASASPYICVMDADLQHDERIIPQMLRRLKDRHDLVVASRYMQNASTGALSRRRVRLSRAATLLGNKILRHELSDPMSGFFMLRRGLFEGVVTKLSGKGFKILLDIVASADPAIRVTELPYHMKSRAHGESKLSVVAVWEFFSLLANKLLGRYLPLRFILFISIGLSGVGVHLSALFVLHKGLAADFILAQGLATLLAMTSNYLLNNSLTFSDRKHTGLKRIKGLLSFYLACAVGAVINLAVSQMVFERGITWWLAGLLGAVVGAVWNFALSSTYTWREDKPLR